MKKDSNKQLIICLIGGLLFHYLFWQTGSGINLIIFSVLTAACYGFQGILRNKHAITTLAIHSWCALFLLIHHTSINFFAYYITFMIWMAATLHPQLRSPITAMLVAAKQLLIGPILLFSNIKSVGKISLPGAKLVSSLKFLLLPALLFILFFFLYLIANPQFTNLISGFFSNIREYWIRYFGYILSYINLQSLLFLALGISCCASLLLYRTSKISNYEASLNTRLLRIRKSQKQLNEWQLLKRQLAGNWAKHTLALKNENTIACLCFITLNLLLLFLNLLDIKNLWLENSDSANFAKALHASTFTLIFSIACAMLVVLYFLDGNLNFYSKNKKLKLLITCWIIQNVVLSFSVIMRDQAYVSLYGLTYKRLGVFAFAILCVQGLIVVYLKMVQRRSLFFLVKVTGILLYLFLAVSATVNWDRIIVQVNLSKGENQKPDIEYLMQLSSSILPDLYQHRKDLIKTFDKPLLIPKSRQYSYEGLLDSTKLGSQPDSLNIPISVEQQHFKNSLQERINRFERKYDSQKWQSWTFADWQTRKRLQKIREKEIGF